MIVHNSRYHVNAEEKSEKDHVDHVDHVEEHSPALHAAVHAPAEHGPPQLLGQGASDQPAREVGVVGHRPSDVHRV